MSKRKKRWLYIMATGLVLLALVVVYRNELVFRFQLMQLHKLGCPGNKRLKLSAPPGQLPACEKLWAHRINSMERFRKMKEHFAGLECDVVFDAAIDNFRIYHPPAAPTELVLEDYFKELKTGDKGLWIDVKGVDTAAYQQAVAYFERCDRLYNIRPYVIIEAGEQRLVNRLAEKGFITAYFLPAEYLLPEVPMRITDSLQQQLSPAVKFISQEDGYMYELSHRVHDRKIITWALTFSNYLYLKPFDYLINDTTVSVVLVNCKSGGYL